MSDGYEQAVQAGKTFALPTLPPGGYVSLAYDGLIRVTEPRAAAVRTWTGRLQRPAGTRNYVQICCKGACAGCDTVRPCTIIGEPLIGQDKQIEMPATVTHHTIAGRDELWLPDGKRIPILVGEALDALEQQLQPWHKAAFGAERQVVYHLYHIRAETTPGGPPASSAFDLVGKVLAIPVEPTPETPPPVAVTGHG